MQNDFALRDAIQIALLRDDPVAELKKIKQSGIWRGSYQSFIDALRALRVAPPLIAALQRSSTPVPEWLNSRRARASIGPWNGSQCVWAESC